MKPRRGAEGEPTVKGARGNAPGRRAGMALALGALLLLLPPSAVPAPAGGPVAVVVHKSNAVSELGLSDLTKLARLDRQHWEAGRKVFLVLPEAGAPEKATLLRALYRMNDQELKQFWLGKIFRGEIGSFPKTVASAEAVRRFVAQVPGSIGFLDPSAVDDTVKVVEVDGRGPGEAGYPLAGR